MRPRKSIKNYIDAEEFLREVIQSQKIGQCTERLGQLLLDLHDHILTMSRFVKKPQDVKDEIKSYSLYRILSRGLLTFEDTSSAKRCFNYFSTSAINNMTQACQRIDNYQRRCVFLPDNMMERCRTSYDYGKEFEIEN